LIQQDVDGASISSNPFSFGRKMFIDFVEEKAALTIPDEPDTNTT